MKTIKTIQKEIEMRTVNHNQALAELRGQAVVLFDDLMKKHDKTITAMVSKVELSENIYLDEFEGWPVQWAKVDFSSLDLTDEFTKELFRDFMLENHFVSVDFENNALLMSQGPAIIIQSDNTVWDQDASKIILHNVDYSSTEERNALIEEYMEKTGVFPSIVSVDRYGNAEYVSTAKKAG